MMRCIARVKSIIQYLFRERWSQSLTLTQSAMMFFQLAYNYILRGSGAENGPEQIWVRITDTLPCTLHRRIP